MENGSFEDVFDVFPIEDVDFPLPCYLLLVCPNVLSPILFTNYPAPTTIHLILPPAVIAGMQVGCLTKAACETWRRRIEDLY